MIAANACHRIAGLYGITDTTLTPGNALLPACEAALRGGMRVLQYRDKGADAHTRRARADQLRQLTADAGALLIINDDPDLAHACGADGVHLGQSDGDIRTARTLLGEDALIGVTCHGELALAQRAINSGANYVAFGRFFPSSTKPQAPPADIAVLGADLPVPKVAIGGINADNARLLIHAGATAVAVIHALFSSTDVEDTARQLARLFPEAP